MIKRLRTEAFTLLIFAFFTLLICGCGGESDSQYFYPGPEEQKLGSLTFQFATAQAVAPEGTTSLRFDLYDGDGGSGSLLLAQNEAFSPQITVANVPTHARSVLITTFDRSGFPTATLIRNVQVTSDTNTPVDLTGSDFLPVTVSQLTATPNSLSVDVGGTGSFTVSAVFSNSSTSTIPASLLTFKPANTDVVKVSDGIIAGVSSGTTDLEISFSHNKTMSKISKEIVVQAGSNL